MTEPELRSDTRMGEQPALRSSSGRSWLIMGALMMVVCVGVLVFLSSRQPMTGYIGAGVVVVLYAGMVIAAIAIRNLRTRLVALAVLLIGMALTALGFVLAIMLAEWSML